MSKKLGKTFMLECWLLGYRFIIHGDNQRFDGLNAVKNIRKSK